MKIKNIKKIPVILFGDHIAAYGVVRALGPFGIPIYVVSAEGNGITTKSRYVKDVLKLPSDTIDFFTYLEQWGLKKVGSDAVLIVAGSDDYLDVLSKNYDYLPRGWHATFPAWRTVRNVRHKYLTFKIAESIGLPTPKSVYVKSRGEFDSFVTDIKNMRCPLILKPENSSSFLKEHHVKGVVFESLEDIKKAYEKYADFADGFNIQEFIPGPEKNLLNFIGIYNKNSEPICIFFNRKIRSSGPLLSCTLMETAWSETIIEYSNRLIKAVGYYGYANVEFKLDPRDNKAYLMEINGRVSMSNSHALICSINLPLAMYKEAIGDHLEPLRDFNCPYGKNIHWWYPLGDLGSITLRKNSNFSWIDYFNSLRSNKRIIEPFNLQDPWPCFSKVLSLSCSAVRRLLKSKFV